LNDGRPALLAELLPELAAEESIRRRYVRDIRRHRDLEVRGLVPILAVGGGAEPWRLRAHPRETWSDEWAGDTLEAWLERRAPAPVDEAVELVARLAEVVHRVHLEGSVIRDLSPHRIVIDDGDPWLADIGLARVDVLSTRTASSLIVSGSPYLAPETLRRTAIDQRADIFGLGVLLFHALTGLAPWDERSALLRPPGPPPRAARLRPELPAEIDDLVARCMDDDPDSRPASAATLAALLRGETGLVTSSPRRLACQHCAARMRIGQRLCVECGRVTVRFVHTEAGAPLERRFRVVLKKAREGADFNAALRDVLERVSATPIPTLNFLIGDQRMYSKEERERLIKLPATLFTDVDHDSATALVELLEERKIQAVVQPVEAWEIDASAIHKFDRSQRRIMIGMGSLSGALSVAGLVIGGLAAPIMIGVGLFASGIAFASIRGVNKKRSKYARSMFALREAPAALPASDPLVALLVGAMDGAAPDVREHLGELALRVQRLVDHRVEQAAESTEIEMVTAPVSAIVDRIVDQARAIVRVDAELAELDEGTLVRALSASQARGEPDSARTSTLEGLDRIRSLEDARAATFHRLLEAGDLLARSVSLGLAVHDETAAHARLVERALQALEPSPPE
jgi:hypothetical protein